MTHSWLITGPPGSGRSNLAYAFATALLSPGVGADSVSDDATRRQILVDNPAQLYGYSPAAS